MLFSADRRDSHAIAVLGLRHSREQQLTVSRTAQQERSMASMHSHPPFDFDAWAALAREDPQRFEKQRSRVLEAAIRGAPPDKQPQLRRTQWKLDQIRRSSATPLAACLRMQQLLWEHVAGEDGLLERLQWRSMQDNAAARQQHSAKILPFTR